MATRGNTKLPGFYFPWPLRNIQFARQIDQSRENTYKLAPLVRAAYVDPQPVSAADPGNHDLAGWAIGMRDFRNKFRIWYDQTNHLFTVQHNVGTEAVETWDDMLTIRESDGRVTVVQYGGLAAPGGFYNEVPRNLATSGRFDPASQEWAFTHNLNTKPVLWDTFNLDDKSITPQSVDVSDPNTAYFYFATAQSGFAVVTGEQSRFEGIRVDDGVNGNVFPTATRLGFDGAKFYASTDGHGMPVINLQPLDFSDSDTTTLPVNLKVTDTAASQTFNLFDITPLPAKIVFNQADFYFSADASGNPIVNVRGGAGGGSSSQFGIGIKVQDFSSSNEWTFNHGLGVSSIIWAAYDDQGLAVIPQKVSATHDFNTAYFYFSPALAGRAVVAGGPVLNSITVAETDGSPSESASKITFHSNDFYIKNDSTGNPVVNFRGTAGGGGGGGVTAHSALTGLLADDHPQYLRTDGTRVYTGTQLGSLHVERVVVADAFYLTPGSGGEFSKSGNDVLIASKDGSVIIADDLIVHGNFYANNFVEFDPNNINSLYFKEQASDPTIPDSTHGVLFAVDNNGHTTIHFMDNQGATDVYEVGRDNVFVARNVSGSTISRGTPVYVSGTTGSVPQISPAQANSATTMPCVGVAAMDIANNAYGRVLAAGLLSNVNTNAFTAGTTLFVSASSPGTLTSTEPTHPNLDQQIAIVMSQGVGNGVLLVKANHMDNQDSGTNRSTFTVGTSAATSVVLTPASTAQRTLTFQDRSGTVALTDQLTGFYFLTVRESDLTSAFRTPTLIFNANDFYLKGNSNGYPTVNLRGTTSGGTGLQNVVEDLTPQLGGNLDVNNQSIVSVTGDIVLDSAQDLFGFGIRDIYLQGNGHVELSTGSSGQVLLGNSTLNSRIVLEQAPGDVRILAGGKFYVDSGSGKIQATNDLRIHGNTTVIGGETNLGLNSISGPIDIVGASASITTQGSIDISAQNSGILALSADSNLTASAITTLTLDAPTISVANHRVQNVSDPSSAQDAATKAYVDSQIAGSNPGFYGVIFKDNIHTLRDDTLVFNSAHFYLSETAQSKPILNLKYDLDYLSAYIEAPTLQNVFIDPIAPYQYTISNVKIDCRSGSATAGFYIIPAANRTFRDGSIITGLDPVTVSTTLQTLTPTGNNQINPGDGLKVAIYGNSSSRQIRILVTARKS